jgi:hypothetical protein
LFPATPLIWWGDRSGTMLAYEKIEREASIVLEVMSCTGDI